jgi:hypothetical protein
LVWDTQSIQVVAESGEKEVRAQYHFRNVSNVPITITSVTTDCGCTTAELSKKNFGSTEAGDIDVAFSVGARIGVNEKTITVTTDESNVQPVQLHLRVDVRTLFSVEPRMVWWAIGEKPEPKSIVIKSQTSRPIKVVAAKPPVPGVDVRIETVEPGKRYRVQFEPARTTALDTFRIELQVDVTGASPQTIYAFALIR